MKLQALTIYFIASLLIGCGKFVPGNFNATATTASQAVTLSWGDSSGADTYQIVYGTTSGNYLQFASDNARSPYTISGLDNGITYYFRVTAVTKLGKITQCPEVVATPR